MQYISICGIFKNESLYLREWLEFHRLIGVEHFYLYNNLSSDAPEVLLRPYVENGIVDLYDWSLCPGQIPAYNDCIKRHCHDSRWIAFIDLDEFLFAPDGMDLKVRLQEFEGYGGVAVCWVMFGSSGHKVKPPGPVIENYLKRGPLNWNSPKPCSIKSIVDPTKVKRSHRNPHSFEYRWRHFAVNENFDRVSGPRTAKPSILKFRLNHYWSKSEEEYVSKMARGRADNDLKRTFDEFVMRDRLFNQEVDTTILQYLPQLKKALIADAPANLGAGSEMGKDAAESYMRLDGGRGDDGLIRRTWSRLRMPRK